MKSLNIRGVARAALLVAAATLLPAHAADVAESEINSSLTTTQNVDSAFRLGANPDIMNAETWPRMSVTGSGDGSFDFYAFPVPAFGVEGAFDIDNGAGGNGSMDAELCLCNRGGRLLMVNDDGNVSAGADGSVGLSGSYITFIFAEPGTYVIGAGKFNTPCNPVVVSGSAPANGDTYELQISLSQHRLDADGDGIADAEDCNPYSDLNSTVFVRSCDTGAVNTLSEDGFTVAASVDAMRGRCRQARQVRSLRGEGRQGPSLGA